MGHRSTLGQKCGGIDCKPLPIQTSEANVHIEVATHEGPPVSPTFAEPWSFEKQPKTKKKKLERILHTLSTVSIASLLL